MKNLLIPLVIGGAVVIGIGAFVLMRQNGSSGVGLPGSNSENNSVMSDKQGSTNSHSFRDFIRMTDNQHCTYRDEMGNNGEVYSANGRVRGNFVGNTNNETVTSHVIVDNDNMFTWFDGATDGFMMSLADLDKYSEMGTNTSPSSKKNVDVDEKLDYDCQPWTVDSSVFTLPSIEFEDFSAMMPVNDVVPAEGVNLGTGNAGEIDQACEACDNLPGEAQTQCRQALGC